MDLSDPVNLAEDLIERVAQGNLTFTKSEVKKIAAMLDKLAWRVGDAYQVAAALADFARMKDDPAVIRALDFLADPMRPGMMGSFVTKRHREESKTFQRVIAGHEAWVKTQKEIARRNRRVKAAGAQKPKTKAASKPVRKKVRG